MSQTIHLILADGPKPVDDPALFTGADLVLFPEITFGGYARLAAGPADPAEAAEQLMKFRMLSASLPATVVGGSVRLPAGQQTATNSCLVYSRGRQIHRYDKIHLFRPCKDHVYFRPGREVKTFVFRTAAGEKVRGGVVICFDLRFPELVRLLALQGMQVLLVPARWPRQRDDAWRTLLKARAIENQIFVSGCNAQGAEGGASYVFDPSGEELLSTREVPERPVHTAVLDLDRIPAARTLHHNLQEAVVLRRLAKGRLRGGRSRR